jgi:hypothetical protein
MHQYNFGAPFERIAIDVAGPFPRIEKGNRYLLIAMDYFTKWPEACAIPDQEASTVADVLVSGTINWPTARVTKTRTKGISPKLQSSWEGPHKVIARINDVVYRIQRSPRSRMMAVHLDRLAPYCGAARDERP